VGGHGSRRARGRGLLAALEDAAEKLARLLEKSAKENPGPQADAAVQRVRTLLEEGRQLAATPESLQPPEAREARSRVARSLLALLHGV
jgi:molecular chaperone DnaK